MESRFSFAVAYFYEAMKCTFFTALFFSVLGAKSQTYQSVFGDSLTQWNIFYEDPDGGTTVAYSVRGELTIGDVTYKEIGYQDVGTPLWLLREDSTHAKLFYRVYYGIDTSEYLLMNLDWKVGDSVNIYGIDISRPEHYSVIDTIYLKDGRKHLRTKQNDFHLAVTPDYFEYVEGIGPTYGIVGPVTGSGSGILATYLLCDYKDSSLVYIYSDTATSCYLTSVGINEVKNKPQFTIQSIATNYLQVQLRGESHPLQYFILNNLGQEVVTGTLKNGENPIATRYLPGGIYYLIADDRTGIVQSKIFLKE